MKFEFLLLLLLSILGSLATVSAKSALPPIVSMASKLDNKVVPGVAEGTSAAAPAAAVQIPKIVKLLIGAGGIYSAFLYYGTLQEDVFHYTAANGDKFKAAWFLQALGE